MAGALLSALLLLQLLGMVRVGGSGRAHTQDTDVKGQDKDKDRDMIFGFQAHSHWFRRQT